MVDPGDHLSGGGQPIVVGGRPAVVRVPRGDTEVDPAEWRYRVTFSSDMRTASGRGVPMTARPSAAGFLERSLQQALLQRESAGQQQMRVVVGHNNLAHVQMVANPPNYGLCQDFWFSLDGQSPTMLRYTTHWGVLTVPDLDETRPGPGRRRATPSSAAGVDRPDQLPAARSGAANAPGARRLGVLLPSDREAHAVLRPESGAPPHSHGSRFLLGPRTRLPEIQGVRVTAVELLGILPAASLHHRGRFGHRSAPRRVPRL